MADTITDFTQALNLTFGPIRQVPRWPPLGVKILLPRAFVMTDAERLSDPVKITNKLPKTVAVIFRHYNHSRRSALAYQLVRSAHRRGLRVLIAGNANLAKKVNADGVHLPSHMLKIGQTRQIRHMNPRWLITAAIHNQEELRLAEKLGVNAGLISPIFATTTRIQRPSLGPIGLRRLVNITLMPIFALGGVNLPNLSRLKNSGATGVAGIGEFLKLI